MRNRKLYTDKMPATMPAIAAATGMHYGSVYTMVQALHAAGEIHIGDWKHHASGAGNFAAEWHLGAGVDVPRPVSLAPPIGPTARAEGQLHRAAVLSALPGTRNELAAATGLSISTVRNHLIYLAVNNLAAFEKLERRTDGAGAPAARYVRVEAAA